MSESDETQEDAKSETASRNGGVYFLLFVIFCVQLAMAGFYYYQHYIVAKQTTSFAAVDPIFNEEFAASLNVWFEEIENEISVLQEDMSFLEGKLNELSKTESASTAQADTNTLEALSTRIEQLEQQPAPETPVLSDTRIDAVLAIAQDIESLKERVEKTGHARWQQVQLLSAFERVEHLILSHKPYAGALYAFQVAAKDTPYSQKWIETLSRFQHEGIPSFDILISQFEAARDAAVTSSETTEPGFWDGVKQNLSQLVEVRKTGAHHSGDDVQSVLARAAHALEIQEYDSLREEIALLPEAKQTYFSELMSAIDEIETIQQLLPSIRAALQVATTQQPADEPTVETGE